ncbi:unnamed protein product [[Candida] boidinii]|nr:unnamed protein product [[Candida] boidinii]
MVKGHIYLHPSLTEAFGTVLVEAASCGLLVVTTNVGGIPEVLPSRMTVFSEPEEDSLVDAVDVAVKKLKSGKIDTSHFHNEIKKMYDWKNVAERTEIVYNRVIKAPESAMIEKLGKFYQSGSWAGFLFLLCAIVDFILLYVLEFFYPDESIDKARKWPKRSTLKKK